MHAEFPDPLGEHAWRRAIDAARYAAVAGGVLLGLTAFWIAWCVNTSARMQAGFTAEPGATAAFRAELVPLILSRDGAVTLPAAVGFALVLLGPFLAGVAAVLVWRHRARAPGRALFGLKLLVGGCALSILPGLFVQVQFATATAHGSGSSGLGPSPMCGGLALLVTGLASYVLLHHGAALRAGRPLGSEPAGD